MTTVANEKRIEEQLRFMFGKRYGRLDPVWSGEIHPIQKLSKRTADNLPNLLRWNKRLSRYTALLKCVLDMEDAKESDAKRIVIAYTRRTNTKRDSILIPLNGYHVNLNSYPSDSISWQNKRPSLFWRGGTTGFDYKKSYTESQRFRFVKLLIDSNHPGVDVGFANVIQIQRSEDIRMVKKKYIRPRVPLNALFEHKFVLNLEGNDCATSFPIALSGNVCPLHPWPFRWESILYGLQPKPWEHFVPVKQDGSDVLQQFEWCLSHDEECQRIAERGKNYIQWYRENLPLVFSRFGARLYDLLSNSSSANQYNDLLLRRTSMRFVPMSVPRRAIRKEGRVIRYSAHRAIRKQGHLRRAIRKGLQKRRIQRTSRTSNVKSQRQRRVRTPRFRFI